VDERERVAGGPVVVHVANEHRDLAQPLGGEVGRQLLERRARRRPETGPQHQVLRRVAGDRQLRERDQIRAGGGRFTGAGQDDLGVAGDVADRVIHLREREAEGRHAAIVPHQGGAVDVLSGITREPPAWYRMEATFVSERTSALRPDSKRNRVVRVVGG
jgi:hypothetical protein